MPEAPPNIFDKLLPVAALVLGYAGKWLQDWLDFRRNREREREAREEGRRDARLERHATFQRQTLLDLQDTIMLLLRSTGAINQADTMAFRQTKRWGKQMVGSELSESARLNHARTTMLKVRVADELVRRLVSEVQDQSVRAAIGSGSEEEASGAMRNMSDAFEKLNERIGELLRETDRQN